MPVTACITTIHNLPLLSTCSPASDVQLKLTQSVRLLMQIKNVDRHTKHTLPLTLFLVMQKNFLTQDPTVLNCTLHKSLSTCCGVHCKTFGFAGTSLIFCIGIIEFGCLTSRQPLVAKSVATLVAWGLDSPITRHRGSPAQHNRKLSTMQRHTRIMQ